MENIIVCDRCGSLIESDFITIRTTRRRGFDPAFKNLSSSYDLCPACAKILSNFFINRPIKIDQ